MPPFVGVAVKVTFVPAQIVLPGFAAMLTDGTSEPIIAMVIPLEVAVLGFAQAKDDVITTVITSPFTKDEF